MYIPKELLHRLRKQSSTLEPVLRIGKNGLSENVFSEINKLLKKRKLIKIKVLSSLADMQDDPYEMINQITEKTHSGLISKTGHVFVLYRDYSVLNPGRKETNQDNHQDHE